MDKITSCGIECLNDGQCEIPEDPFMKPFCRCKEGFDGNLCESELVGSNKKGEDRRMQQISSAITHDYLLPGGSIFYLSRLQRHKYQ